MRTLFILFLLLAIGGLGFAAYWFYFRDVNTTKAKKRAYPIASQQLDHPIQIGKSTWGFAELSGETWRDLLYAQGLNHGVRAGNLLYGLRELFKGNPDAQNIGDLRSCVDLFHYLDLESTASACEGLYPPNVRVLLQRYADGLNDASEDPDGWTVQDVLLMQRGYAFLLGRNFNKELGATFLRRYLGNSAYQTIRSYQGPINDLPKEFFFTDTLRPLFEGPYMEWVRIQDAQGNLGLMTRSTESMRRLFVPTTFIKGEEFRSQGITLAGVPFLLSGQTTFLQYQLQPIQTNDEQFQLIPNLLIESDPSLVVRVSQDASYKGSNQPAGIAPFGRDITPLVTGNQDTLLFYDWAGFQPSADLLLLWRLLSAESLDQAQAALSLHMVPAVEITLATAQTAKLRFLLHPQMRNSDMPLHQPMPPFAGASLSRKVPVPGLRNWASEHFRSADIKQWRQTTQYPSQLDQQFADVIQAWSESRLGGRITSSTREGITNTLKHEDPIHKSYFIHLAWQEMISAIKDLLLKDMPHYLMNAVETDLKRLILSIMAREQGAIAVEQRQVLIAQALARALRHFQQVTSEDPALPIAPGQAAYAKLSSQDVIPTPFTLQGPGSGKPYLQTHANLFMSWQDDRQQIWLFPFQMTRELGWPKKIYRDSSGVTKTIRVRAKSQ